MLRMDGAPGHAAVLLLAAAAELVGEEELFAELVGAEVLAEVLEALLEGEEGGGRGVGAGAEAGGLARGTAADGGDFVTALGVGTEGVFEQSGERGREHLGEMAGPGAESGVTL